MTMPKNSPTFETEFLENYLKFGFGSMPKVDIDALVMSLLERYGLNGSEPMASLSNQVLSERLRAPVAKVKQMRYAAALKFGGSVEDQARGRLLAALANASIEPQEDKICLIIEDSLAKAWLQGQLKTHQQIYDHPFNSEIVRVPASGMFTVLATLFEEVDLLGFKEGYEQAKSMDDKKERIAFFTRLAKKFAEGAAETAGAGVVAVVRAYLPLP